MVVVGFGRLARWSLVAGRWPADGRCASRLCRSPPSPPGRLPLLSTRVPPFPSRPCPVPISTKSKSIQIPNPNPRSMFTVYVYLEVHTHPHPCPAGTLRKHEQQTNTTQPFSLPVAPFPAFDWTGLDLDLDWHLLHSVLDTRRHITSTTPGAFLYCVSSHGEASRSTSKTKATSKRTTRPRAATTTTKSGDRDDITPQTMSFPTRHRQLLPHSLHTLATTAH